MSDITFEKQNGLNPSANPGQGRARRVVAPPIDVFENADEILVVADVPGAAGEQIDLRIENGILQLEAKRAAANNGASPALAREYEDVDYMTTFRIPAGIDNAAISAQTKNGTLHVHLPKAQAAKPRKIAVS